MPRKCIICGASQSFNLPVYSYPKPPHERAAWIAVVQEVIPGCSDPLDIGIVTGPRSGICAKHFQPQDIRKGKTSSLCKRAIPILAKCYGDNGAKHASGKMLMENKKGSDNEILEKYICDSDWKEAERKLESSVHPSYIESNSESIFPDDKMCRDIKNHHAFGGQSDNSKTDVCLICGKSCKDLILMYKVPVNDDTDIIASDTDTNAIVGLLSRIVGKPKREIFFVSLKICSRCLNLVQEVSLIENGLKSKKQTIKDMFDQTLQDHREQQSKLLTCVASSSSLPSFDINYNAPSAGENNLSLDNRLPDKVRPSSRRQISSKKYYCPTCKEVYPSLALWVQHCSKHTDNEDSTFINRVKSSQRTKTKRKLDVYSCDECNKTFCSKQSLLAHAPAHQKGTECNICGRYLSSKARLIAHLFKMHEIGEEKNKEVECSDCGKCFTTKAGLRYHRNVVHRVGTKYICEQCDKVFYYHVPFNSHMLYAHGEKKVICETCGEKFFTVSKLNAHINAVHRSAKSWTCKECKSKFTTQTAYRHHMNVKHLKVQHACGYCNANFRKKSSLVAHLGKHSVFVCQMCKEIFSQNDDLKNHMAEVHGKEINLKGRRKSSQLVQKRCEEPTSQPKDKQEEPVQQNEHVTSIVINDLLITAESYDNSGLQPFSLTTCEKLPEKQDYSSGEVLKGDSMNIIDSSSDLQSVDPTQFDTVETLQIKAEHDHIEMAPGVSLINVQILSDMEISQSDTLGDLKNSILDDATDHMSHDGQLENEDNLTDHLTVETADELSVGNDLESTNHLENSCHLVPTSPLDSTSHLEVNHELDTSPQLQVETGNHFKDARNLVTETHMDRSMDLEEIGNLNSVNTEPRSRCHQSSDTLQADTLEPKDHLHIPSHIGDTNLDGSGHLEVNNQSSLPSIISQIDNQATEQMTSHLSPHIHDISTGIETEIVSHIGSDIHDITSKASAQRVDPLTNHMTTQIDSQIDHMTADVSPQMSHIPEVNSQLDHLTANVDSQIVSEVADNVVAHISPGISAIATEVSTQIADHTEASISADTVAHMGQKDEGMVNQGLNKQLEKIDSVELEPFSVTLDQKDVQYQYVMYISASGDDSNQD